MIRFHTNHGVIDIELDHEQAPKTAANFEQYARDGFYEGTLFHRVIPGFVIQGGGMTSGLQKKPTREPITNEADNGLKNRRGTLSMARTNDPHSATSQFFVNLADNAFLDHQDKSPKGWGYAVFARVVQGMEAVDGIAQVPTGNHGGHQDVPKAEVVVKRVEVFDNGGGSV